MNPTNPIRYLGIDPGETQMGWAVVALEGKKFSYFASGRSKQNLEVFINLLETYTPRGVGVESVGKWGSERGKKNIVGLIRTAEQAGLLAGFAKGRNYPVYMEPAHTRGDEGEKWKEESWRKKLCWISNPDAIDVLNALRDRLDNLPQRLYGPSYEDERDALGIAIVAAQNLN